MKRGLSYMKKQPERALKVLTQQTVLRSRDAALLCLLMTCWERRVAADAPFTMIELSRFPEVVETASLTLEPHAIAQYLRELATAFHTAYHAQAVLVEDGDERDARLALSTATAQVLKNGLDLLGVSAPVKM